MTTQIGASVFVDPSEITHSVINDCPTITFGPYPTVNRVDVHLRNVAGIDAVIAELVALKQEMDPPVVPPCGKCHYPLDSPGHDEMCEQRAAFLAAPSGMQDPAPVARVIDDGQTYSDEPEYPAAGSAIPPEQNGGTAGYVVGECGHRVAGSEWRAGFRVCERCPVSVTA